MVAIPASNAPGNTLFLNGFRIFALLGAPDPRCVGLLAVTSVHGRGPKSAVEPALSHSASYPARPARRADMADKAAMQG